MHGVAALLDSSVNSLLSFVPVVSTPLSASRVSPKPTERQSKTLQRLEGMGYLPTKSSDLDEHPVSGRAVEGLAVY